MIEDADRNYEEISETQINEVLEKPPFYYERNSVNALLERLAKKKIIIKYKRGHKNYFTRFRFTNNPFWMFTFISLFEFLVGFYFLAFYEKSLSTQRYYYNIDNGFFVNHHHITILFVSIMVIMNIIIVLSWKKSLEKYKKIISKT